VWYWWCPRWAACPFPLRQSPHMISLRRNYASLFHPATGAHVVPTFLSENNSKLYFFLHELIAFYEQASSRTSWLMAFFVDLDSWEFLYVLFKLNMPVSLITFLSLILWVINWQHVSILRGSIRKDPLETLYRVRSPILFVCLVVLMFNRMKPRMSE
jgi:hypothetical protein